MLKLPNIWTWKGSAAASLHRLPLLSPCCALAGHTPALGQTHLPCRLGPEGGGWGQAKSSLPAR